jgi:hypothetical protein
VKIVAAAAAVAAAVIVSAGCGGGHGARPPSAAERAQIVHWVRFWWKNSDAFAAVRGRGLSPGIAEIRVSRLDSHYATAVIRPRDASGKQQVETQTLPLIQAGGVWSILLGPGDVSAVCSSPSPKPLVELICG